MLKWYQIFFFPVDRSRTRTALLFQYSLSFIAFVKSCFCSSISSTSWLMNVRFGFPQVLLQCADSHYSSWWEGSSLLRQQCPLNLTLWAAIAVVIFGISLYNTSFLMCCFHDTFLTTLSILYNSHPASFQVPLWGSAYMSRKVTRLSLLSERVSI